MIVGPDEAVFARVLVLVQKAIESQSSGAVRDQLLAAARAGPILVRAETDPRGVEGLTVTIDGHDLLWAPWDVVDPLGLLKDDDPDSSRDPGRTVGDE